MEDLTGRVAVVTGGASGIGLALARRLAGEGMNLVLADIEEEPLQAVVAELFAEGTEALAVPTDVSVAESVEALAARTREHFGAAHLVCNNAGVATPGRAWDGPLALWEWTFAVNLWGVVHGIRAFLPMLLEQDEGHIVNTASAAGLRARPFLAPYVASKHAVVGLSESLLYEMQMQDAHVGVSVLCPTWVNTRILDGARNWLDRFGAAPEPDDESKFLAAVASEKLGHGLDPADVAAQTVDAVRAGRFWILPDPASIEEMLDRGRGAAEGTNPVMPAL